MRILQKMTPLVLLLLLIYCFFLCRPILFLCIIIFLFVLSSMLCCMNVFMSIIVASG